MNIKQRKIATWAACVIGAMLIFPPFQLTRTVGAINMGYAFILEPPTWNAVPGEVNISMLFIQWLVVVVIAGIALVLAKDSPK